MAPTDPRYLDASLEEIVTEFWAHHYDNKRLAGKENEVEDEDESFDQDEIEALMRDHPDDWMDILSGEGG